MDFARTAQSSQDCQEYRIAVMGPRLSMFFFWHVDGVLLMRGARVAQRRYEPTAN